MAQTNSTVDEIEFTPEGIDTRLTFHPDQFVVLSSPDKCPSTRCSRTP